MHMGASTTYGAKRWLPSSHTVGRIPMRTGLTQVRIGILVIALATATSFSCSQPPPAGDEDVGTVGFELQVAPGVTISTISWNITGTGFTQSGNAHVAHNNTNT